MSGFDQSVTALTGAPRVSRWIFWCSIGAAIAIGACSPDDPPIAEPSVDEPALAIAGLAPASGPGAGVQFLPPIGPRPVGTLGPLDAAARPT